MSSLFDQLHYYTIGIFDKHGDPRTAHYPLVRTPWPTLFATLLYYLFVSHVGPRLMRDRKPLEIKPLIRTYNSLLLAWGIWGFTTGAPLVRFGLDLVGCVPVIPTDTSVKTLTQIHYGYMFFVSRFVEFADTIFFILRKKNNQVSSFHVFHHSIVPPLAWFFIKYSPGGNAGIFVFLNTFVHIVMYSYYTLATFPSLAPYLWWKKYLTQLQIVQFLIVIAFTLQPLFIPGCKFPKSIILVSTALACLFIYLFVDFYLKAYKKQRKAKADKDAAAAAAAECEGKKVK